MWEIFATLLRAYSPFVQLVFISGEGGEALMLQREKEATLCLLLCKPFVFESNLSPADVSVRTDVFGSREHMLLELYNFEPEKNNLRIIQQCQLSAVECSQRLDSCRISACSIISNWSYG